MEKNSYSSLKMSCQGIYYPKNKIHKSLFAQNKFYIFKIYMHPTYISHRVRLFS